MTVRLVYLVIAVPVVALVATVWLPFVNSAHLWLGLPSVMVWSAGWVLAITPTLALLEFSRSQRTQDRQDDARRRQDGTGEAR